MADTATLSTQASLTHSSYYACKTSDSTKPPDINSQNQTLDAGKKVATPQKRLTGATRRAAGDIADASKPNADQGATPRHYAASPGRADVARALIESPRFKWLINKADINGQTPLHFAARMGHVDVCSAISS